MLAFIAHADKHGVLLRIVRVLGELSTHSQKEFIHDDDERSV